MPKRKMKTGMLCRDSIRESGLVVFFSDVKRQDIQKDFSGLWNLKGIGPLATTFTETKWGENYDLKPPKHGSAFEVEIEL